MVKTAAIVASFISSLNLYIGYCGRSRWRHFGFDHLQRIIPLDSARHEFRHMIDAQNLCAQIVADRRDSSAIALTRRPEHIVFHGTTERVYTVHERAHGAR